VDPFATSTTVTGPVGERLQAGNEYTPVLYRPAPLRHLHNSGATYKYPYLLTYLLTYYGLNEYERGSTPANGRIEYLSTFTCTFHRPFQILGDA